MPIGYDAIANLYTALNAVFNAAFTETEVWFDRLAMTVPSNTATLDYKMILDWPGVREWIGDRQAKTLMAANMTVTAKDWEGTISIHRNDVEDDQIGLYVPRIQMLAMQARQAPQTLLAELIKNGHTTTYGTAYDGQPFFSTSHVIGDGSGPVATYSNYDAGSDTSWYLFDIRMPVKPFLFQLRQNFRLTTLDRDDSERVFMRKEYLYGVDARYNMAYALPQLAYKSTQPLNPTNYAAARAAMMSLKNANGDPLRIMPNLLVVPPQLEGAARELLYGDIIIGALQVGGSNVGGGKTNVWRGTCDLLVVPELA